MVAHAHFLIWYSIIDYLINLDCSGRKQIDILEKHKRLHNILQMSDIMPPKRVS